MAKVPRHTVAQVVAELSLKRGSGDKQLAKDLAAYLLETRRVGELDSIMRDVQKFWAKMGHVDVLARVARPLPQNVYDDLVQPFKARYPEASSVNVTPVVDTDILGGASLELAEQRMDISVARRLRRFKKAINVKGT